jgi:5-methyltetrahydrofolate--homocysteine methyltransferase
MAKPNVRNEISRIARERILVLDGAWGTLIHGADLGPEDYRGSRFADHPVDVTRDPDVLNLTRPDFVADAHRRYLDAGADITTTNTFTATSIGQADYGLEPWVYEMNVAGARIAREAAGDRFVAGSVGPLNVTLSLSPKVDDPGFRTHTFDQVKAAYAEQMIALAEGGVDLLLLETIFDTLNAKAAIAAAREHVPELPLWISATIVDRSGRTLSGQTIEAFWASVEHAAPVIVGVNCSLGAGEMRSYVADFAHAAPCLVSAIRTPGSERLRRLRRDAGDPERSLREFAEAASSTSRGLLRLGAGAHGGDRSRRSRPSPLVPPQVRAARAGAALEPFEIGPDTGFVLDRRAHE